jgi:hypothetical protein
LSCPFQTQQEFLVASADNAVRFRKSQRVAAYDTNANGDIADAHSSDMSIVGDTEETRRRPPANKSKRKLSVSSSAAADSAPHASAADMSDEGSAAAAATPASVKRTRGVQTPDEFMPVAAAATATGSSGTQTQLVAAAIASSVSYAGSSTPSSSSASSAPAPSSSSSASSPPSSASSPHSSALADVHAAHFFGASRTVRVGAMVRDALEFEGDRENQSGRANAYGPGSSRGRSKIDQYVEDERRFEEAQRARAIERMALLSKPLAEPVRLPRGGQRDVSVSS